MVSLCPAGKRRSRREDRRLHPADDRTPPAAADAVLACRLGETAGDGHREAEAQGWQVAATFADDGACCALYVRPPTAAASTSR
jgi:hypothetical protein